MSRLDEERRYRLTVLRWRAFIWVLRVIYAFLRIGLIAIYILLFMAPVSPVIRFADTQAGECRYLGARGLWEPGWASHCPRLAWRQHFPVNY
jgi:hypothetical protein